MFSIRYDKPSWGGRRLRICIKLLGRTFDWEADVAAELYVR